MFRKLENSSLSLFILLLCHAISVEPPAPDYKAEFEAWKQQWNKSYTSIEDEKEHFEAFKISYDEVQENNAKNLSYRLHLGKFADIHSEEFSRSHGLKLENGSYSSQQGFLSAGFAYLGEHQKSTADLPDSWDWSSHNAVTSVKDQSNCGACWAFAGVGALSGAFAIKSNGEYLLEFSEQQLIDCDPTDTGCNGGNPINAFNYLKKQKAALCTVGTYPYKSGSDPNLHETCEDRSCEQAVYPGGVIGFTTVNAGTDTFKDAIYKQPVAVQIMGDPLKNYNSGVLTGACSMTGIDHAVLATGWASAGSQKYWIIKNSWGTNWGMSGYARIEDDGDGSNGGTLCIQSGPSYPTVDAGKVNPSMKALPIGTIILAALGGIAGLFVLIMGIRCYCKKRRQNPQLGTEARGGARQVSMPQSGFTAFGGAGQRLASSAPTQPPATSAAPAQPAAAQSTGRKGNSAASRLLQEA